MSQPTTPRRCDAPGVCQGHQPPCAGCIEHRAAADRTPTPPPGEWLDELLADLKAALALVALMAFGTLALAALLSNHIQIG